MKHKKPLKITSRSSSVTNGFVQAILPDSPPTAGERTKLLTELGMNPDDIRCVYCDDVATDWDHLRPLVSAKRPTGYLTDHHNLVPACGPCNQSKGGQAWESWMRGAAVNSPRSRGILDLEEKIQKLRDHENATSVKPLNFPAIIGEELWDAYWQKLAVIEALMHDAQKDADVIRARLTAAIMAPDQ